MGFLEPGDENKEWFDRQRKERKKKDKKRKGVRFSEKVMNVAFCMAVTGLCSIVLIDSLVENERTKNSQSFENKKADSPHAKYLCDKFGREVKASPKNPSKNYGAVPCNEYKPAEGGWFDWMFK